MMQLSRISLVQWHLFGREDLDLFGDTAVLGKNRSGKSTLIDLIQTVMTGGSARYYRFNRSAGESGNRGSERTLRGYCLGQLGDGDTLRDSAVTHLALLFEDPDGERPPVSIGLCVEASLQEDARVAGCYVAPGVRIHTDLLVEQMDGGHARAASWTTARRRLEDACAAAGSGLIRPDTARNFIREYMRQLFTGRRYTDPERFVRAFVMALSFEDMRSVSQFVHQFLLERKDIDIGELRESIGRYQDIQKDIRDLERRLEALREIKLLVDRFEQLLEREEVARGTALLAATIEAGAGLVATLRRQREIARAQTQTNGEILRHNEEITALDAEIDSLIAQLAAQDAASQRAVVQSDLKVLEHDRSAVMARLRAHFLAAARGASLIDHSDRLASLKLGELMRTLAALRAESEGQEPPAWPRNPIAMDALIDAARPQARAALAKVIERRDAAIAQRHQLEEEVRDLQRRLDHARTGRVRLEEPTAQLITQLEREGMRPRALCQVAEVLDEGWREAAEAFFARDREAIIVDAGHAARAVEILRAGRDTFRGCRVANTRRLATLPIQAAQGTLACVLASDDPLAMAFIVFRAGQVELAETQSALLAGGRAIMRDGAYNSGIVVEVLRTRDVKIGRAAVPLMEQGLRRQIGDLTSLIETHRGIERFHEDIAKRLEGLAQPAEEADRLDRLAIDIAGLDERRTQLQLRLDRISAMVDPALRTALEGLKAQREAVNQDKQELVEMRGGLQRDAAEALRILGGGQDLVGSRACLRHRWAGFRDRVRNRAQLALLRSTYRGRGSRPLAPFVRELEQSANQAKEDHRICEGEIRQAHGHYRLLDEGAPVIQPNQVVTVIKPWVTSGIEALETNELIQYRRQAEEAARQVVRIFRTAFIHELNARFNTLRTEVDLLNRALKTRPLHNEIYSLHFRPKEAFSPLYRLARESEENETLLDLLFDPSIGGGAHAEAVAEVERLLGDPTLDFSAYQDYRAYFDFDLRMEDVTNGRLTSYDRRRGVASGAERQVPYYVIIGAALASIYHGTRQQYDRPDLGLGLAVFDEAFSKMDGPNQRTLLDFYAHIGLQVVIAAPSEKRSVVYENLDSIVDVFRHENMVTAETARIKPHARAEMRAANPQHLSETELSDLLARRDIRQAGGQP